MCAHRDQQLHNKNWVLCHARPGHRYCLRLPDHSMTAGRAPIAGFRCCCLSRGCSRLRVLGHPLLGLRRLLVRLTFYSHFQTFGQVSSLQFEQLGGWFQSRYSKISIRRCFDHESVTLWANSLPTIYSMYLLENSILLKHPLTFTSAFRRSACSSALARAAAASCSSAARAACNGRRIYQISMSVSPSGAQAHMLKLKQRGAALTTIFLLLLFWTLSALVALLITLILLSAKPGWHC